MIHPLENFTLIFGAMKCGTTSLFNYLSEHPQIAPCKSKEPNFFTHEKSWRKGIKYYRSLWDYDPSLHTTAIEASINYSKVPRLANAAERICEMAATEKVSFKLIYVIRNPVERIISHCTHDLEERWSIRYNHPIIHGIPYPAINVSKYAMQLDEYYQRFSPDNILLLQADDLRASPQRVLKQVCSFLEIDDSFVFSNLSKQHNPSKGKIVTNRAWPTVNKYVASPLIQYFPQSLRSPAMQTAKSWFRTGKVQQKFEMSEAQYHFVLKELHDDLQRLRTEYGVDISKWNLDT